MTDMVFQSATLRGTRRYRLHSDLVGETFQIDVALPNGFASDGPPLPVAIVTDANTKFGMAVETARFLQSGDGARPAILVGVGYCLDGLVRPRDAYGALRTRDFTPSIDEAYLERVSAARNGRPVPEDILPAGGADRFLAFLIHELRPFIEERYKVDPADQTLVGSSLGGLFGIDTYFRHPDAFSSYVINSPSLWWNNCEIMDLSERIAPVQGPARTMFLSVGGDEPNDAPSLMVDNFHRLVGNLGKVQRLELTSHVFDGETHTSVIPAGLSRGLRTVFGSAS